MKTSTQQRYQRLILDVIDYIYDHIDHDVDVNTLAEIACMSPYHFHRVYRTCVGEPVYQSVKRMRLLHAAAELIRENTAIADIAKRAHYQSTEAFSRAFLKHYSESPSEFRNNRNELSLSAAVFYPTPRQKERTMYTIEMLNTPELQLIGLRHKGDYLKIGNAFEKVSLIAANHQLLTEDSRFIGVYYQDPESVPEEELQSFAGIVVPKGTEVPEEFESLTVPAGKSASLLFKGDYSELAKPYNWMFGDWLPESGHQLVNFPPFEEYLNDVRTTPPSELLTRINCLVA